MYSSVILILAILDAQFSCGYVIIIIIIIIIRQMLCPVVGRRPRMPSPNYPVLCCPLPYRVAPVFVQVVSPPLGWSPLSSFLLICFIMVSKWWQVRSIGCLWGGWYALPRTITFFSQCTLYLLLLSSPWPRWWSFYISLYVRLSIILSILVCAAASLFGACLVSVQVSAPYVIAGSTEELYTCLSRQVARRLLKISRCLAYADQPAMILRCISLSWFFSLRL